MNDYLFLMKEYLQKSIMCFNQLEKAHEDTVVLCDKTEAKTKAQAVGGTAAGVALAGGSTTGVVGTASFIAGVLKYTVGTIVGLSPIAAGATVATSATVAGAGVGLRPVVGTDRAAKQLEELASGLQRMRVEMKSIERHTTRLSTTVKNMKIWLEQIEENRKMLECTVKLEESTTSMKRALYISDKEMDADYEAIMGQKKKKL